LAALESEILLPQRVAPASGCGTHNPQFGVQTIEWSGTKISKFSVSFYLFFIKILSFHFSLFSSLLLFSSSFILSFHFHSFAFSSFSFSSILSLNFLILNFCLLHHFHFFLLFRTDRFSNILRTRNRLSGEMTRALQN